MVDVTVFEDEEEYKAFVKEAKSRRRLHGVVEQRLRVLLSKIFPDAHATQEVSGILGGRNDLMLFFFNGRRVVFELFFSPSQVPQDLRLLEQSKADVRIAILLDPEINPKLADEYFRKKPEHFSFLWLKQVMVKRYERFCMARLKELIDEAYIVTKLRRLLATPAGSYVEQAVREQIENIESRLALRPRLNLSALNVRQLTALLIVLEVRQLGIPPEKLRPLYTWLQDSIEFAFELVSAGFQAFLITDLREHFAIWSDGDLADDLILGAGDRSHGVIVLCLNHIINRIFEGMGIGRRPVRWHFFHTYTEFIGKIEPIWPTESNLGKVG